MRTLTTPVVNEIADKQYVSEGRYRLFLNADDTINQDLSYYMFVVTSLPGRQESVRKIAATNLPVAFKNKLKELHQMVVNYAESEAMLLPGTDEDDL